jgi:membrane associated rhomboid family serine protease
MKGCVSNIASPAGESAPKRSLFWRLLAGPPELTGAAATRVLILLNIVVYVGEIAFSRSARAVLSVPGRTILSFGGNYAPFVFGEGRAETLLSSCFLHWSLMHLAFNMYALRQVGPFVERTVGLARFLPMYLVSGVAGSVASASWGWLREPDRLSAGASGAICGVIGTAAVLGVRVQGWGGPLVRAMLFWLGITIVLGFFLHADNSAHIGGALVGAVFAGVWKRGVVYTRIRQRIVVAVSALAMLAGGVTVAVRYAVDPYAALDLDDRLALGERFVALGDCPLAIETTERALRIGRWSPNTRVLEAKVIARCR